MQTQEKKLKPKEFEVKEETVYESAFIHSFKYIIDHANTRFFFLIFLSTIFGFFFMRLIVYTALCDSFCTTCCIFSVHVAWQFSHVYSHTNLFEYMNFLKIIHDEEYFII